MQTQPPYAYAVGSGRGQLVGNEAPYYDWTHFCEEQAAISFLNLHVLPIAPDAMLQDWTNMDGGYIYSSDGPNVKNIRVWVIVGTVDASGNPQAIGDFAGQLIDARTKPRVGIDTYPAGPNPQLVYSASEQGLVWK